MENHKTLTNMLPTELIQSKYLTIYQPNPTNQATNIYNILDKTNTNIQLAQHLITHPNTPTHYVQLINTNIFTDPQKQNYNTHTAHMLIQDPNLQHMTDKLCTIINKPNENNPNKLDLDKHFILINTKFGRTPYTEFTPTNPNKNNTNH